MLTPEQAAAIQTALTGVPVKIIAFAGAGKTSTLTAFARHARGYGIYAAFNKAIAEEAARKFPRTVTCKTTHQLAYRSVMGAEGFDKDKMGGKVQSRMFLSMPAVAAMARDKGAHGLSTNAFASAVFTVIRNYCMSWDDEIQEKHSADVPGLPEEKQRVLDNMAAHAAGLVWSRMIDGRDKLPLGHDGYLKVYALSRPRLAFDYIMVDEAQDLNAVMIGIMRGQTAQMISVGDSHQQIYAWRGARDALKILPGTECRLTQSFRFGAKIAHVANQLLFAMGETHPLRGFDLIQDSVITDCEGAFDKVDAILCRSNAAVIGHAIDMQGEGRKVYIPGGTAELAFLIRDAQSLQAGGQAQSVDLMAFESWSKVREFADTPEGAGLRVFVSLVDRFGCSRLLACLDAILTDSQAQMSVGHVTISTAHKSKGLEWNRVLLDQSFAAGEEIGLEERRLFYVAATRAKQQLYIPQNLLQAYSEPMNQEG